MSRTILRFFAGATVSAALVVSGLSGQAPTAQAAGAAPTCDQAALNAAVVTAAANERAAHKAYTVYTHTSMKVLAEQLKAGRIKKAREARIKGHQSHKTRTHQARVRGTSKPQILNAIKAERARLKAVWDAARKDLRTARTAAAACNAGAEQSTGGATGPGPNA